MRNYRNYIEREFLRLVDAVLLILEQAKNLPERSFFSCGPSKAETHTYIQKLIQRLNARKKELLSMPYVVASKAKSTYWIIERLVGLNSDLKQLKPEAVGSDNHSRIQNFICNDINTVIQNIQKIQEKSGQYTDLCFNTYLLFEICYQAIAGGTFRSFAIPSSLEQNMTRILTVNSNCNEWVISKNCTDDVISIFGLILSKNRREQIHTLKRDTLFFLNQAQKDTFIQNIFSQVDSKAHNTESLCLNSAIKIAMRMFQAQKHRVAGLSAIACFKAMLLYMFLVENIFSHAGLTTIARPKDVQSIKTPYFFGPNTG